MTDAEMSDLLSKPEDYYVTAEMMYRYTVTNGGGRHVNSYGAKNGHYYLGTVSEAGYNHGNGSVYNALRSCKGGLEWQLEVDIPSGKIDKNKKSDVYIVSKDFSWTYVRTHELDLGPYLCVKK